MLPFQIESALYLLACFWQSVLGKCYPTQTTPTAASVYGKWVSRNTMDFTHNRTVIQRNKPPTDKQFRQSFPACCLLNQLFLIASDKEIIKDQEWQRGRTGDFNWNNQQARDAPLHHVSLHKKHGELCGFLRTCSHRRSLSPSALRSWAPCEESQHSVVMLETGFMLRGRCVCNICRLPSRFN